MIYLLTGACGTGKTYVVKYIIKEFGVNEIGSCGLYSWQRNENILIVGKYDGSTFEGSDRLSMAIMQDNAKVKELFDSVPIVICEGDRFTNSTFLNYFDPVVIRIKGDGNEGRQKRGSSQTHRHIQSIATRVMNVPFDVECEDSSDAIMTLEAIIEGAYEPVKKIRQTQEKLF